MKPWLLPAIGGLLGLAVWVGAGYAVAAVDQWMWSHDGFCVLDTPEECEAYNDANPPIVPGAAIASVFLVAFPIFGVGLGLVVGKTRSNLEANE